MDSNVHTCINIHSKEPTISIALLQILLAAGADCDMSDRYGMTLLHYATKYKQNEAVDLLLSSNADTERADTNRMKPIQIAIMAGNTAIFKLLYQRNIGLSTERYIKEYNDTGYTLLHDAVMYKRTEIVRYLLSEDKAPARQYINELDKSGQTYALHVAIANGHIEMVKMLLDNGSDMRIVSGNNESVLHYAASSGQVEMLRLLFDRQFIEAKNKFGETPLYYAVRSGNVITVRFLLEKGANVKVTGKNGTIQLSQAISSNYIEIAKLLKKYH